MCKEFKTVRPSVRLDEEFNKELKKLLIDKGITFQDLAVELLEKWYKENK